MRCWFGLGAVLLLLFVCAQGFAASMYVTDTMEVTMRTGRGIDHKIIAMVPSGQRVEVLQKEESWTLVRLSNGREGYIFTRYLISEKPKSLQFDELFKNNQSMLENFSAMTTENQTLQTENERLIAENQALVQQNSHVSADFDALKDECAGYLTLKEKFETTEIALAEKTLRANQLEEEVGSLVLKQFLYRFLAGAGVLMVGFFIGYSARKKQRSSYF